MRNLKNIWKKNRADFYALLSGRLQNILNYKTPREKEQKIPIFVFHSVKPRKFENQLKYLAYNGYKSIDADTLVNLIKTKKGDDKKTVALTFDDATGSFWSTAFPLLKKYGLSAILFAIPGLVPNEKKIYPNLEDVWNGRSKIDEIINRERIQPLCTWQELKKMNESGIIDIQSHSLTHSRINVSPEVVDFIHPEFDPYFYENINIPVSITDSSERPLRKFRLGEPVYKSASRLSGEYRWKELPSVVNSLVKYVQKKGGEYFFSSNFWRSKLKWKYWNEVRKFKLRSRYETTNERDSSIRREFSISKEMLETNLSGTIIGHFCYPWFQGSEVADKIAKETGYKSVFYGIEKKNLKGSVKSIYRVFRVSEEYLLSLPGKGRVPISAVMMAKTFRRLIKKKHWRKS